MFYYRYSEAQQLELSTLKVSVYKNLHNNMWSVKALSGPLKNKVILHADELYLHNCYFSVSERGRQRVLNEKRKNVHASVIGYISTSTDSFNSFENSVEAYYNPYTTSVFINKDTNKSLMNTSFSKVYMAKNSHVYAETSDIKEESLL